MKKDKQANLAAQKGTSRRAMLKSGLLAGGVAMANPLLDASNTKKAQFEGQVAFVTGGARGIGRASALQFAKNGAHVALFDIAQQIESVKYPMSNVEDLAETQRLVENEGVNCMSFQGDVRKLAQIKGAVSKVIEEWGSIDFLLANAGIATLGPLESMTEAEWKDVLDVNLSGPAFCIQAISPHMKKQKFGRIVCISSINGRRGSAGAPSYTASKWGLIGLTKSVALELGKFDITANAICPTGVNTGMFNNELLRNAMSPGNPTEEAVNEILYEEHALPVGMLKPDDIADSVLFFCSPQAKRITGVVLDVAAGTTALNSA